MPSASASITAPAFCEGEHPRAGAGAGFAIRVIRARQWQAALLHASQVSPGAPLWRRLEPGGLRTPLPAGIEVRLAVLTKVLVMGPSGLMDTVPGYGKLSGGGAGT